MKGVILAGGHATRLMPATKVTNKHLLDIGGKVMIEYPLGVLKNSGINEILVITGATHMGDIVNYLGDGSEFGVDITYKVQKEAGGIAQAVALAKNFSNGESIAVILGDNIFEEKFNLESNNEAKVFLKEVKDPERFGVPVFDGNKKIIAIEEKPKNPKSNYSVTGLYVYDNNVFKIIKNLKPSTRGELEITDVNNEYLKKGKLSYEFVNGFWSDAGTKSSLQKVREWAANRKEIL